MTEDNLFEVDAPEQKYTDRHVREDPSLRDIAEGYVILYGGDFEPLLNAKRELRYHGRLSTRTTRVVLNCMRYDTNVSDSLLAPKAPVLSVVKGSKLPFCFDPRPHNQHGEYRGKNYERCEGVPWPINRSPFWTTARIRARYAAAGLSSIYHLTSGKGMRLWLPPAHALGQAETNRLEVDLVCKYPSILTNPMLFKEEPTHLVSTVKPALGQPRVLCRHCAKERTSG